MESYGELVGVDLRCEQNPLSRVAQRKIALLLAEKGIVPIVGDSDSASVHVKRDMSIVKQVPRQLRATQG